MRALLDLVAHRLERCDAADRWRGRGRLAVMPEPAPHTLDRDARRLRRSDFPELRQISTRWADVDVYGHVNNVVHYAMFDTVVNGWLIEASGVDIRRLDAIGLVVESSCHYHAELEFPAAITAGLALERFGTSSVVYRLALFGAPEPPAATGRFVHVYVDRTSRRPVRVPDEVRAALTRLER